MLIFTEYERFFRWLGTFLLRLALLAAIIFAAYFIFKLFVKAVKSTDNHFTGVLISSLSMLCAFALVNMFFTPVYFVFSSLLNYAFCGSYTLPEISFYALSGSLATEQGMWVAVLGFMLLFLAFPVVLRLLRTFRASFIEDANGKISLKDGTKYYFEKYLVYDIAALALIFVICIFEILLFDGGTIAEKLFIIPAALSGAFGKVLAAVIAFVVLAICYIAAVPYAVSKWRLKFFDSLI